MQLNFSGKQDVYLEVAARFKEYIKLGIYKNGDKLPSVREAAGELGVNPNTIARAYATLEKEGLICSLPKKGAFVTQGKSDTQSQPDKRAVISALRDMGIEKQTLIDWIEEVYGEC
ncbi:MAG: GntR family transcriptional regulator [Clostridia bacterium]|nr:GntR family transcriptional regulator [Clostridia bacterium]